MDSLKRLIVRIAFRLSALHITYYSLDAIVDYFELQGLFDQFRSLCSKTSIGPHFGITKATFETCLGPVAAEKNLILDRIYAFFDQDKDDLISFSEFVKGLSVLAKGSFDERVYCKFSFNMHYTPSQTI